MTSSILCEPVTVENSFLPSFEHNIVMKINEEELNKKPANDTVQVNKKEEHICLLKLDANTDY